MSDPLPNARCALEELAALAGIPGHRAAQTVRDGLDSWEDDRRYSFRLAGMLEDTTRLFDIACPECRKLIDEIQAEGR